MFHDINFTASVAPILDQAGREIPAELGRGVYREDTGELMSICGPHYKPVQHMEVLMPHLEELDSQGYVIEERAPSQRALYDLAGKKGAFVTTKLVDGGAVLRADIITGDFIEPTGKSSYLKNGPDTMLRQHLVLNSHNQKYAVSSTTRYCRLICMNGIVKPTFSVRAVGKHTLNFNIEGLRQQILKAVVAMEEDAELFGLYATTRLSVVQAEEFVKATFAKLPNKPNGDSHFSDPLLQTILRYFQHEEQTVWGLVQALTYWATHDPMKGGSNEVTGRLSRDQKVAQAMRSGEFKKLLAA